MPYFRAFSAFSVTATNFMNSITFVMNHLISYFDISICHCSNRTLCYHLFKFHGFNHGYFLGGTCYIHLTKETFYIFNISHSITNKRCCEVFLKIDFPLKPYISFESSSNLRNSHHFFFRNTYIKLQLIYI